MRSVTTHKLGFHRGNKRVWINNRKLTGAGFVEGLPIKCLYEDGKVTLNKTSSNDADFFVSNTKKGAVVDINNARLTKSLDDFNKVEILYSDGQIIIRGSVSESRIKDREHQLINRIEKNEPLRKGGLFVGVGLLCRSIERGVKQAGVNIKQRFANELEELPAEANMAGNEIWKNNEDGIFVQGDIFDLDMSLVPKLDTLILGSPCTPFSKANVQRQKEGRMDVYHDAGTVFQPILEVINRSNPAVVLLENSPSFKGSIVDHIMSDVMARYGYKMTETTIKGSEFGGFEKRERLCRVWFSENLPYPNIDMLAGYQQQNERPLSSMLEDVSNDSPEWSEMTYLKEKTEQAHNNHKHMVMCGKETIIPTINASYFKRQADTPMIGHQTDKDKSRLINVSEHCNIRDIHDDLKDAVTGIANGEFDGIINTRTNGSAAHRMLGNSCSPEAWEKVGEWLGKWLMSLIFEQENSVEPTLKELYIHKQSAEDFGQLALI
ncbi:hypothetical protein A3715_10525 [Oleiphilus sp. HI0009]|nr:hypothetical protein A3715_10525 [Oleiphilus sp. HI0009]